MENASKALLIAAAVLVVIILIAVGMKIYTSTTGTEKVATDTGTTINDKTKTAKDIAISEISGKQIMTDPFNYGEEKTKATVAAGNEITITNGTTTEYFTVISNTNGTILAMPKYNITLTEDHPVQSSSAGTTSFSTRAYWSRDEQGNEISGWNSEAVNNAVDIDMSNAANNIQKYINAYKTTLEDMGAEGITVRAAKYSELSGVTAAVRNSGQTGRFWLGSGYSNYASGVWCVSSGGNISSNNYYNSYGVRPVIIIS